MSSTDDEFDVDTDINKLNHFNKSRPKRARNKKPTRNSAIIEINEDLSPEEDKIEVPKPAVRKIVTIPAKPILKTNVNHNDTNGLVGSPEGVNKILDEKELNESKKLTAGNVIPTYPLANGVKPARFRHSFHPSLLNKTNNEGNKVVDKQNDDNKNFENKLFDLTKPLKPIEPKINENKVKDEVEQLPFGHLKPLNKTQPVKQEEENVGKLPVVNLRRINETKPRNTASQIITDNDNLNQINPAALFNLNKSPTKSNEKKLDEFKKDDKVMIKEENEQAPFARLKPVNKTPQNNAVKQEEEENVGKLPVVNLRRVNETKPRNVVSQILTDNENPAVLFNLNKTPPKLNEKKFDEFKKDEKVNDVKKVDVTEPKIDDLNNVKKNNSELKTKVEEQKEPEYKMVNLKPVNNTKLNETSKISQEPNIYDNVKVENLNQTPPVKPPRPADLKPKLIPPQEHNETKLNNSGLLNVNEEGKRERWQGKSVKERIRDLSKDKVLETDDSRNNDLKVKPREKSSDRLLNEDLNKKPKICNSCNTLNSEKANFCINCGNSLKTEQTKTPPAANEMNDDIKTCPVCTLECKRRLNFCSACNFDFRKNEVKNNLYKF